MIIQELQERISILEQHNAELVKILRDTHESVAELRQQLGVNRPPTGGDAVTPPGNSKFNTLARAERPMPAVVNGY